ncbi:hypothetical protein ACMD2_21416, partial [Ananas comosus]
IWRSEHWLHSWPYTNNKSVPDRLLYLSVKLIVCCYWNKLIEEDEVVPRVPLVEDQGSCLPANWLPKKVPYVTEVASKLELQGSVLLFIWNYNKRGEASSPTIVLKTRRSLRAVHFHPCAAPFLLMAEVNSIDSSDPPLTLARSSGYLHYPPPTYYFANTNPSLLSCTESNEPRTPSPMDISTETTEGQSMS